VQVHTSVDNVGGSTVIVVDGIVDLAAVGRLHDDLTRAIRRHPGVTLLVDLDAVSVLDDTGLPTEVVATEPASHDGLALLRRLGVTVHRSDQFLCHYDQFAAWADTRGQLRWRTSTAGNGPASAT
jgi:hypothetical protein